MSETPVKIVNDVPGVGAYARKGDVVSIDYKVKLEDGKEILNDRDFHFKVGAGNVIEGIDDAIRDMRVGGSRTIICPPHKHWGRLGYADGTIPPKAMLTIEMKLRAIR